MGVINEETALGFFFPGEGYILVLLRFPSLFIQQCGGQT